MFTRNRDRRLDGNIVRGCLAAMPTDRPEARRVTRNLA
jgi:hypothetical protein